MCAHLTLTVELRFVELLKSIVESQFLPSLYVLRGEDPDALQSGVFIVPNLYLAVWFTRGVDESRQVSFLPRIYVQTTTVQLKDVIVLLRWAQLLASRPHLSRIYDFPNILGDEVTFRDRLYG